MTILAAALDGPFDNWKVGSRDLLLHSDIYFRKIEGRAKVSA